MRCKDCKDEIIGQYLKSKDGLIVRIYNSMKGNSIQRRNKIPDFTAKELKKWAFNQQMFHKLFDAWVESNYEKMLIPSFDRTDDYQGYSLDRLQIMTWQENRDKMYSDIKRGANNKNSKEVNQLTKSGIFIKKHYSYRSATRETGINTGNIGSCCNGNRASAGGFKWEHT